MLDAFERFPERVHDEPKHTAHLTQKSARELANSLGNQNGRINLCHGRQTSPYFPAGKRAKLTARIAAFCCSRFPVGSAAPMCLARPHRVAHRATATGRYRTRLE